MLLRTGFFFPAKRYSWGKLSKGIILQTLSEEKKHFMYIEAIIIPPEQAAKVLVWAFIIYFLRAVQYAFFSFFLFIRKESSNTAWNVSTTLERIKLNRWRTIYVFRFNLLFKKSEDSKTRNRRWFLQLSLTTTSGWSLLHCEEFVLIRFFFSS